jgi:hypothetical protein
MVRIKETMGAGLERRACWQKIKYNLLGYFYVFFEFHL